MANEMVERVTKAIQTACDDAADGEGEWCTPLMAAMAAKAAIAAMREPSEMMSEAAWTEFEWGPPMAGPAPDSNPADCWRAMIDAALKEDDHGTE